MWLVLNHFHGSYWLFWWRSLSIELKLHEAFYRRKEILLLQYISWEIIPVSIKTINKAIPFAFRQAWSCKRAPVPIDTAPLHCSWKENSWQDCRVAPLAFVLHFMCQLVGRTCPSITMLTLGPVKNRSCKYVCHWMSDVHRLVSTMVADKISVASSSHTVSTLWHSESKVYLILLKKSRSRGELNCFFKVILMLFII